MRIQYVQKLYIVPPPQELKSQDQVEVNIIEGWTKVIPWCSRYLPAPNANHPPINIITTR